MANIVEVLVPKVGESVTEILEVRIIKNVGDFVEENGVILEGDSDKASVEVVSPISGFVKELLVEEGADFPIGEVIAKIEEGVAPVSEVKVEEKSTPVEAKAETSVKEEKVATKPAPVISQPVQTEPTGGERRVKMSPLRRTIARRLVEAQQNAAILTTFNEADMTAIKELRKRYQDKFVGRHGTKLGFMSFFAKAVIEALKEYPAVNAEIDGNYIIYKDYYNISIAVSGPRGLMVPVIRNADQMSFSEVELEIKRLAGLARDNKLKPDDFKGGTFTISNGGVFGSLMSTPILNRPQVGILGMHTIQERPVNVNGKVEIRPMMYLALSYDHRIIDGSEAVSFLVRVKELVENPERILFDV